MLSSISQPMITWPLWHHCLIYPKKDQSKAKNYTKSIAVATWKPHGLDCSRDSDLSTLVRIRTQTIHDPAYKTPVPVWGMEFKQVSLVTWQDGEAICLSLLLSMALTTLVMLSTSLTGPRLQMAKTPSWKYQSRDYMKSWSLFVNLQAPSDSRVCRYQERVHLIVPGQNGVEKEDVVIGTKLKQWVMPRCLCQWIIRLVNLLLGTAFAWKAEVLSDENPSRTSKIAKPQGFEWTEKGRVNALSHCVVLRLSQVGAIVAPSCGREAKPEFDLSAWKSRQEQRSSSKPSSKSHTRNSETAAEAHSQNLLPNTGTESRPSLPLLSSASLALLGLGWLIKKQEKK